MNEYSLLCSSLCQSVKQKSRYHMASNSNTTPTRESRRRKILERGADRLALIAARTQALPSESHGKPNVTVSSQPLNSRLQNPDHTTHQINAKGTLDDGGSRSVFPNNDSAIAARGETTTTSRASSALNEELPLVSSSADQTSSTVESSQSRTNTIRIATPSPSQISSAIAASESSRLFCSVIIALFVVLSSLGFPIPMLASSIIASFRPLYLVLLTNLTLVLARLLFNNHRGGFERAQQNSNIPSTGNQDWIEQAGKAFEIGLVMQKAIDAVLMDCSVYAIIIILGFSLVK